MTSAARKPLGASAAAHAACVAAICVASIAGAQAAPCPAHRSIHGVHIALEAPPGRRSDTVRTVRVCMHPAAAMAVGSFHLFIEYDSTLARAVHFGQGLSGTIVANLTRAGRADIAGADPGGFSPGELASLTFTLLRRANGKTRAPGAMVLRLLELNATTGANIAEHVTLSGIGVPASTVVPAGTLAPKSAETPHIDSLGPSRAKLAGSGGLVSVTIYGSGFRPDGNAVLFAGTEIAQLTSDDGTSLRLVLPSSLPGVGEVPPKGIRAGQYELRVRTTTGTSNPTTLTLEPPQ